MDGKRVIGGRIVLGVVVPGPGAVVGDGSSVMGGLVGAVGAGAGVVLGGVPAAAGGGAVSPPMTA